MKHIVHNLKKLNTLLLLLALMGVSEMGWGQTHYNMSNGNYFENFDNIANSTNWPNGFNGTDCQEWASVAINNFGTIGDGVRITVSTSTFTTGTSGGVQRGTQNIHLLSTSTSNSCAIDLLLNFTGRIAGTVSFDLATVFNSSGNRNSILKLFYSTNGTTFIEITGTNLPYTATNNVTGSASITNISLPSALNNSSTARLRFYEYSTSAPAGSSGSQPKISIDNITVTSTASSTPSLSCSALTGFGNICVGSTAGPNSFTITGTNLTAADITVAALSGFTYSTTINGTYTSSLSLPQAGGSYSQEIFVKFTPSVGVSYNGNIAIGGGGASSVNCVATGSGISHVDPVITTFDATSVVNTKATMNGSITTLEVCPTSTARGFVYSKTSENSDPLIGGSNVTDVPIPGIGIGSFTYSLTDLNVTTGYSYKAYIYNGSTYAYGAVKTFSTLNTASKLAWGTAVPTSGLINSNLAAFTVLAQRPDGTTDMEYAGNITISKASGPGNISGTLTAAAVDGVATFSGVQFDALGTYTITASSGSLSTVTSGNIVILTAPVNLGTYTFSSTSCSATAYTAEGVASNLTFSLIAVSNITCNNNTSNSFSGNASWGTTISTSRYIEFTLTPVSGYLLTANSVVFDIWRSAAGAQNYAVRSSIDNYTANLATGTVTASQTTIPTISLPSAFANLNAGITFRIYGWGGNSSGDIRIDNIIVSGNIVSSLQAPTSTVATEISSTGFTANWNEVVGSTGYFLDVATTSNFTTTNTIATEGFENIMSLFSVTNGVGEYFSGNSSSGANPASAPFYSEGSYGFGKSGTGSASTVTITSTDINTSSLISPELSFNLSSFSIPSGNGADAGDNVTVEISPNGGVNYYSTIRVNGANNATWAFSNTGVVSTLYDGDGSVVDFNTASGTVKVTGLPSVTNLRVRISLTNDNTAERWIIDNFLLIGNTLTTLAGYSNLSVAGTSQVVSELIGNASYYYRVRATDGTFTSDNSATITVSTSPSTSTIWSGASSNDWNVGSNWSAGIPASTTDVTIPFSGIFNFPTLDAAGACKSITIESGASLLGNNYLSVTSTPTVKRAISGVEQWHLLSSPVTSQSISGDWTPTGTYTGGWGYDFYAWEESDVEFPWLNQKVVGNNITNFVPGKGYLVAYETPGTKEFIGALNSGDITFNLKNSGSKSYTYSSGWNLIGNPYPSAIDWNLVNREQFQDEFAYIYNGTGYTAVDGSLPNAYIAANQGFFVLADVNNQNFTFTDATRVHGGSFLKNTIVDDKFVIQLANENYSDHTTIRFREQGNAQRDRLDALKLFSFSAEVPQVYTRTSDGFNVAVNSIPGNGEVLSIPLSVRIPTSGNMTLSLQNIEGAFTTQTIYLRDQVTGVNHNLSTNPVYSFTAAPGDDASRFSLHFASVGLGETPATQPVLAYYHDGALYVNNTEAGAEIMLFGISGQLLKQQTATAGLNTLQAGKLSAGVYVVRVQSAAGTYSSKVIVTR